MQINCRQAGLIVTFAKKRDMKKILPFILSLSLACYINNPFAQSLGDYRSAANGDWAAAGTWQMYSGIAWIPAVVPPTPLSGIITIKDSVTVSGSDSADQVVVTSAGVLNILGGATLKLLNGSGTDLSNEGRLAIGVGGKLAGVDSNLATANYTSAKQLDIGGGIEPLFTFGGTATQTVHGTSGSGYFGRIITLDNAAGLTVTGIVGFGGVTFVNGKIWSPGSFILGQYSGSNFTGQGAGRFIDGNVVCIVYDETPGEFNLPVGKGDQYLPVRLKITLAENKQSGFVLSIKDSAAPGYTMPVGIQNVSQVRYYKLTNPSNTAIASAQIRLAFDTTDHVSDTAHLVIAKSDTTGGKAAWVSLGGAVTGGIKAGNITSEAGFTSFGYFALANTTGGANTLPVKFTAFTAATVKQAVKLNWSTVAELNTSHFNIERLLQGSSAWQTAGSVVAIQQSTANNYSFIDNNVNSNSTYFYRIQEVDKDGKLFTSKTLQVRLNGTAIEANLLYPNPVGDVVRCVIANTGNDALTISITSAGGKTVRQQKTTGSQQVAVNVKGLAAGTYYFNLVNEKTGERVVRKFVKL